MKVALARACCCAASDTEKAAMEDLCTLHSSILLLKCPSDFCKAASSTNYSGAFEGSSHDSPANSGCFCD